MPPLSGYSATFPNDVLLDSGIAYLGSTVLATLRGGLKFDPGTTLRAIPFDGRRTAIKGLDRRTEFAPKISGIMIELPASRIITLEPGASITVAGAYTGATSYKARSASTLYVAGDYLTDVRCVWQRGDGSFCQVRFPVGLVAKYDITSQDNDEGQIAVEIAARLDMTVSGATLSDIPYRIELLAAVNP